MIIVGCKVLRVYIMNLIGRNNLGQIQHSRRLRISLKEWHCYYRARNRSDWCPMLNGPLVETGILRFFENENKDTWYCFPRTRGNPVNDMLRVPPERTISLVMLPAVYGKGFTRNKKECASVEASHRTRTAPPGSERMRIIWGTLIRISVLINTCSTCIWPLTHDLMV